MRLDPGAALVWLVFTVTDDGAGFGQAATPKGTGLQGISDRLAVLGGTMDVICAPGHGTRVTGRVPVTPAAEPAAGD